MEILIYQVKNEYKYPKQFTQKLRQFLRKQLNGVRTESKLGPFHYSRVHSEEHPARHARVVLQLAATTKSNTMIFFTSAKTPYHHQQDNVKPL